jgi:ABC-2 type transport system permease protein
MITVGLTVATASTVMLDTSGFFIGVAVWTAVGLAIALSGLAVGMGAAWPDFKADSAARAAAGPSAMMFMVLAIFFVGFILAIEAYPVFLILRQSLIDVSPSTVEWAGLVGLLLLAQAVCVYTAVRSIRWASKRVWLHVV